MNRNSLFLVHSLRSNRRCKLETSFPHPALLFQQSRTIVRIENLVLPEEYPEPWPYKERGYRYDIHGLYDRTRPRFHQNTKLFTIEGNVGTGKDELAKKIADAFGFHYMREFRMDDILIDRYGNDVRNFYHMFPKRFRIPDFNLFFKNPYDNMSAVMQDMIYYCRWEQWLNALAHMFNTGQGVIMKRPVYSDFIFANAMREKNYIGSEFFKRYYFTRKFSIGNLQFWPHVVIFLDCPVSKCLENIKKRGRKDEIKIVDEKYLKTIEESYKDVLNEHKRHSKILVYDWSNPSSEDVDRIIEDIENLNMEFFEWHNGEMWEEWFSIGGEVQHTMARYRFTDKFDIKCDTWDVEYAEHECAEMNIYPYDYYHYDNVMMKEVLKSQYSYGYIPDRDPIQGTGMFRHHMSLPEKWIEYYWKEQHFDMALCSKTYVDPLGKTYDPDYLHHH